MDDKAESFELLDGWGEFVLWLCLVVGGATGYWNEALLERHFGGFSGSIFGLGQVDRWQGLCGGVLLGGLLGVALLLIARAVLHLWVALTDSSWLD